jgi:hypothetical protein
LQPPAIGHAAGEGGAARYFAAFGQNQPIRPHDETERHRPSIAEDFDGARVRGGRGFDHFLVRLECAKGVATRRNRSPRKLFLGGDLLAAAQLVAQRGEDLGCGVIRPRPLRRLLPTQNSKNSTFHVYQRPTGIALSRPTRGSHLAVRAGRQDPAQPQQR